MSQCLAYEHDERCDRFDGHLGPHVRFTVSGGTAAWNDPIPCKNCGRLIHQRPEDYLRRWFHVDAIGNESACRLTAAP